MENTFQRDFDIVGDAFMNIFYDPKYRKMFEMNATDRAILTGWKSEKRLMDRR